MPHTLWEGRKVKEHLIPNFQGPSWGPLDLDEEQASEQGKAG